LVLTRRPMCSLLSFTVDSPRGEDAACMVGRAVRRLSVPSRGWRSSVRRPAGPSCGCAPTSLAIGTTRLPCERAGRRRALLQSASGDSGRSSCMGTAGAPEWGRFAAIAVGIGDTGDAAAKALAPARCGVVDARWPEAPRGGASRSGDAASHGRGRMAAAISAAGAAAPPAAGRWPARASLCSPAAGSCCAPAARSRRRRRRHGCATRRPTGSRR